MEPGVVPGVVPLRTSQRPLSSEISPEFEGVGWLAGRRSAGSGSSPQLHTCSHLQSRPANSIRRPSLQRVAVACWTCPQIVYIAGWAPESPRQLIQRGSRPATETMLRVIGNSLSVIRRRAVLARPGDRRITKPVPAPTTDIATFHPKDSGRAPG